MVLFIIEALWLVAAAYTANAFPVIVHGKKPLDLGKTYRGRRVLGDGKTIIGTIAGILFGIFIGSMQVLFQGEIPAEWGLSLTVMTWSMVILLSVGAIVGDLLGSFVKRRYGIEQGGKAPLLDQLGFLIVAFLFVSIVHVPDLVYIVTLLIITPLAHVATNGFAYLLKIKDRPW